MAIKDKKMAELEKRLQKLETILSNSKIGDTISNSTNDYQKSNNIEKTVKMLNLKDIKKEIKSIKTSKPINEICLFPESGNYIESSGPKIFDKNNNLIISLDNVGFCEHICILSENLVILSQKNILSLLRIINIKQNQYKINNFTNNKNNIIKKIIKGLNDNEIITSDVKGNIWFWKLIIKNNDIELEPYISIEHDYDDNTYILLFKNILIVGVEKLCFYDIKDLNYKNLKNTSSFNIKPLCWNAMTIIDENNNLIGIGCENSAYILQVNDLDKINIIKEIKIYYETYPYEALCVYQKDFLIIGMRYGNIHFFDINNNYELIKTIQSAHKIVKGASINGVIELSDGSFASYGEDKIIKIWYKLL